jgi:hypothetical protein
LQVLDIGVEETDERPPALLGDDTEEQGTDRRTVFDPGLREARSALLVTTPRSPRTRCSSASS